MKIASGTKYHNQTESTVNQLPSNAIDEQPRIQLIHTKESSVSNQAIDSSYPPGAINARHVVPLMTPSGVKSVILLTDELIDLDVQHDYLPGCAMPEQGHVWSDRFESVSQSGNPTISEPPLFSQRTEYYIKPFQFFNSHVLVRLVCKPALSQSQTMWVSRSDEPLDFSNNRFVNEIGFSWNPSRANEIFVLMPWYNEDFVVPVDDDYGSTFGYLNVRNITELVTSTGNDAPLTVNYYFCPYKLYTYVPKPVSTEIPSVKIGAIEIDSASTSYPIGDTPLGSIELLEPTYIIGRELKGTQDDSQVTVSVVINIDATTVGGMTKKSSTEYSMGVSPVVFPIGTYDVSISVAGSKYTATRATTVNWFNVGGSTPVFTPISKGVLNVDDSIQTKEIKNTIHQNYFDSTILPTVIPLNPTIRDIVSRVSNGFHLVHYKVNFETNVISQNPDIVESKLLYGNSPIFKVYESNKKAGKEKGFNLIFDFYTRKSKIVDDLINLSNVAKDPVDLTKYKDDLIDLSESIDYGREEIFEYQYNPRSSAPASVYGKMDDHNPRENRHDMYLETIDITSTNKYTPFNFEVDLSRVDTSYPYINTREYLRHYIKSRMPIVYIRSNKSPYSNLMCRIVQGTYSSYEEVMQLPGQEWDPSETDMPVQPYWFYQTPGVTKIKIPFTVVLLSGQIDDAGMQLMVFFNTSTLEYHHKIDYNPGDVTTTSTRDPTVTVNSANTLSIAAALGVNSNGVIPDILNNIPDLPDPGSLGISLPSSNDISNLANSVLPTRIRKPFPTTYEHSELRRRRRRRSVGEDEYDSEEIEEGILQGFESETKVEREEGRSLEERSTDKLEGVQMETNRSHYSLEKRKVQSEKDFHYVGAITTPFDSNLKFIAIPINHSAFGKTEVTSAKPAKFWQGEPTFKVTTTLSSTLSGIIYIAQVPEDFDFTNNKAESAIRMYPRTQKVAWNESGELPIKWYSPKPQLTVEYVDTVSKPQLGYLVIAFPTVSGATFTGGDNTIKITIHCDTANIGYSRASYRYPNFSYPGLKSKRYAT